MTTWPLDVLTKDLDLCVSQRVTNLQCGDVKLAEERLAIDGLGGGDQG